MAKSKTYSFPAEKYSTKEETLAVKAKKNSLTIGMPAEISEDENRITLIPSAVHFLIANGNRVIIQSDAGYRAGISDKDYSEAGAEITESKESVFQADMIVKVDAPTLDEINLCKENQFIFSSLHKHMQSREYFYQLANKKITAIHYEGLMDTENHYPMVMAMSEIAGNVAVFIAQEYLSDTIFGKGKIMGNFSGISPVKVVIIGSGIVALHAAKTALSLGAYVKIFDESVEKLRRINHDLQYKAFTSLIQSKELSPDLQNTDVLICAMSSHEGYSPCVVTEDMIMKMQNGSVAIDVSIDRGGCIETSCLTKLSKPVFVKHNVTHYCVPNIPSKVPFTASTAMSNYLTPLLLKIHENGGVKAMISNDAGFRNGIYMFDGLMTNKDMCVMHDIPYKDIELLILVNY